MVSNFRVDVMLFLQARYRVSKKTLLKEIFTFLTLKMLPLALVLLNNKLEFLMARANYPLKRAIFDQWIKKMVIFGFDQR